MAERLIGNAITDAVGAPDDGGERVAGSLRKVRRRTRRDAGMLLQTRPWNEKGSSPTAAPSFG